MNPLLKPFDAVPFSEIRNEHFLPAIEQLIQESKDEFERITNNPDTPTFENTVVALERSGDQLNRVTGLFFNLNGAETNEELQSIAQEVSPMLSDFYNDLLLNQPLFERVKHVYDNREQLNLDSEDSMLLKKQYRSFARNGANLNEADKKTLRKLDAELSKLKLTFGEHVLAETNAYELHITEEEQLAGLPEGIKEAAAQVAQEKNKEGWVFTLDYPSYIPFLS